MSFDRSALEVDKARSLEEQRADVELQRLALEFVTQSDHHAYAYQWTWRGLPILQLPQDIVTMQEIIDRCRPTVIIETGVAWGGGIALYGSVMDQYGGRLIIGIDLNLADSVSEAIHDLGLNTPVSLLKASSTEPSTVETVISSLTQDDRVMIVLDSNHTHDHVLSELEMYGPLVSPGQYCVVSDTIVELIPEQSHRPRPWGPGNNPWTAVQAYLATQQALRVDEDIDARLLMSLSPRGYLFNGQSNGSDNE